MNAAALKERYRSDLLDIRARHLGGADSFVTTAALTVAMDTLLREAFAEVVPQGGAPFAVCALGGYGRAELFPHSDVDIMILCRTGGREVEELVREYLHVLWDAGVTVGHSVRTLVDCAAVHGHTLDAWVAMVESRPLCGDEKLATELRALLDKYKSPPDRWLINGVLQDQNTRHERFGDSVKLLEPNVKKSAGGLRDLHTILWLFGGADPATVLRSTPDHPATQMFLDALHARGEIDAEELQKTVEAVSFLFRVRHEMHFQRDGQHDTLDYALQLRVAEGLGFGSEADLRSVEVFMREYYRHARTLFRLNRTLLRRFRELAAPAGEEHGEALPGGLRAREETLGIDAGITQFTDATALFEAFALAAERQLTFDDRLRGVVERSIDLLDAEALSSPPLAAAFRRILRSRNVAAVLREMNDVGILGKYIPEFGQLVSFFQHNVYHYFTADEHTLIALANAERLRENMGYLREVYRRLERRDLLFMAVLLHDMGKPLGVADHEITGVAIAHTVLQRLGLEEIAEDVAFLVRNHLLMEQVAFRRNIHDPATLREFTGRFPKPALIDYLYLLTYADLSAVNPNVWTEWKASILQELHQHAAEVLRRKLSGEQVDHYQRAKRKAAAEQVVATLSEELPREEIERHLKGIQSPAYVASFTDQEIAQHIQKISGDEPVSALFSHNAGHTEVTVIGRDAPFTLSKFCAVLSANDANIFDANIFTRDDGVIIDRFRVADAATNARLEHRVCSKIADDLKQVAEGKLDIDHLFEEHHRKWKRRPKKPANPTTRIDVEFEEAGRYTIIDVYAPDSVGFLYRVTEAISRMGLDIYFAKIATRVDGIIDAFYVLDRNGKELMEPDRREGIRREILRTIRDISGQELV
jgi:[protein-PII] uridylyltransferase